MLRLFEVSPTDVIYNALTSVVEGNKEVLFGSMKTSIKAAQKNAFWRTMRAAGNSVGRVAALHSNACARTVETARRSRSVAGSPVIRYSVT